MRRSTLHCVDTMLLSTQHYLASEDPILSCCHILKVIPSYVCVLMQVPILFNLSDSQLLDLAQQLKSKEVAPGEVVIKEGDDGDCFYIIESGTFSCYLNDGTKLALIDRGSCFGELALLHNDKRKCNVAAEKSGGTTFLSRVLLLLFDKIHKLTEYECGLVVVCWTTASCCTV